MVAADGDVVGGYVGRVVDQAGGQSSGDQWDNLPSRLRPSRLQGNAETTVGARILCTDTLPFKF